MKHLLWVLLLMCGLALADDAQRRYQTLINELRCLVCQNQAISESNAPLAQDLREQVRTQIAAGRTDDEIRQYLIARYGDYVLYRPPLSARTLLLWTAPFLLMAVALALAWRRSHRTAPRATPDAAALRRLLDEERP